MRAGWRLLGLLRRSMTLLIVVALLATNVLAFTSTAFVGLVSGAASAVGLTTVQAAQRAKTARVARSLVGRTVTRGKNIVRRLPAKMVPMMGGAAVATFALLDIRDACETLDLAAELDPDSAEAVPDEVARACALDFGDGWALLDYARDAAPETVAAAPEQAE